jgi:hypothetical protein
MIATQAPSQLALWRALVAPPSTFFATTHARTAYASSKMTSATTAGMRSAAKMLGYRASARAISARFNTIAPSTSTRGVLRRGCKLKPLTLALSPRGRGVFYSTVTDFARLRGWSTSWPSSTATWYAKSCSITVLRMAATASSTAGISKTSPATPSSE